MMKLVNADRLIHDRCRQVKGAVCAPAQACIEAKKERIIEANH
jgi:hypothetical protein